MASMPRRPTVPTLNGQEAGRESSTGMAWAFEDPQRHWAEHDARQVRYWRTRPPEERLAQAAEYRRRRHGTLDEPATWTWRFLGPGEQ